MNRRRFLGLVGLSTLAPKDLFVKPKPVTKPKPTVRIVGQGTYWDARVYAGMIPISSEILDCDYPRYATVNQALWSSNAGDTIVIEPGHRESIEAGT